MFLNLISTKYEQGLTDGKFIACVLKTNKQTIIVCLLVIMCVCFSDFDVKKNIFCSDVENKDNSSVICILRGR